MAGNITVHGDIHVNILQRGQIKTFRTVAAPTTAFKGRQQLLTQIHEKLTEFTGKDRWQDRTLALTGVNGIGRTELVRKFVQINREAFPNVAWINAETVGSMKKSFRNLAEILEVPFKEKENGREIARKVYRHVGQYVPSSLFIFANANGLNMAEGGFGIFDYLPRDKYTHQPLCLIISQLMSWDSHGIETLEVQELTKEESIQYLTAIFQLSQHQLEEDKVLGALIRGMYECVGGYPLGLQLAAANVRFRNEQPPHLLHSQLEIFLAKVKELEPLNEKSAVVNVPRAGGMELEQTFRTAYYFIMLKMLMDERTSKEWRVLRILAYTDPDATPCMELEEAYDACLCHEAETNKDRSFSSAIQLLKQLLLVQTWEDFRGQLQIRIHRLVQSLLRQYDAEGHGLYYLLQAGKIELAGHYFSSQPELAIPPAILADDQLIICWLRSFITHQIKDPDSLNEPALAFDSTHEQPLRARSCACTDDILATVKLVRQLQSAEWKMDPQAAILGLIDYAKRIEPASPVGGSMFELALKLMHDVLVNSTSSQPEALALTLKEWLPHPNTRAVQASGSKETQYGLLVETVLRGLKSEKDKPELRKGIHGGFDRMGIHGIEAPNVVVGGDLNVGLLLKVCSPPERHQDSLLAATREKENWSSRFDYPGLPHFGHINHPHLLTVTTPLSASPSQKFWTVSDPVENFVGRKSQLNYIKYMLQKRSQSDPKSSRVVALVGIEGIGKTEIARQFAHKNRNIYENAAWIHAESEDSIKRSFISLASLLDISVNGDDDGEDIAQQVFQHVNKQASTQLFIYDGADSLRPSSNEGPGVLDFLPEQPSENSPFILITSQRFYWETYGIEKIYVLGGYWKTHFLTLPNTPTSKYKLGSGSGSASYKKRPLFSLCNIDTSQALQTLAKFSNTPNFWTGQLLGVLESCCDCLALPPPKYRSTWIELYSLGSIRGFKRANKVGSVKFLPAPNDYHSCSQF